MRTTLLFAVFLAACSAAAPADGPETSSAPLVASTVPEAANASEAQLVFQVGWVQAQHGAVVRGGHVDVTYDRARMFSCHDSTVFAYARFEPGGETFSSDEALGFSVPADATSVQLWFHAVAPTCDEWDSDYGRNWRFAVVAR